MKIRKRNWLGETKYQEMERRVRALEIHIRQLSLEQSQLYAEFYKGHIMTEEEIKERIANSGEMQTLFDTDETDG